VFQLLEASISLHLLQRSVELGTDIPVLIVNTSCTTTGTDILLALLVRTV